MGERETTLKDLFRSAKRYREKLDTLDTRSDDFRFSQNAALKELEDCRDLITQLALYSTNETIEDVSTQDIQYLAVDYLLADLLLRSYDTDRLSQLNRASELLEIFLKRLDDYDLLSHADRRLYERYRENRQKFSLIVTTNLEERRNQKISQFQREKGLKGKLKLLQEQSATQHVDEETSRNLYLAELSLFVYQSFQSFDAISQELSILSQMQHIPSIASNAAQDTRENDQTSRRTDGYSERLDGPVTMGGLGRRGGPLLSPSGKPLQPFTLTDKRTQLQNGVFRSGHNLPTMSIDEYLEEERRRGGIIEGGGNAAQVQTEPDEDNMDLVDAATMKAREWDEFVEANPKGAGNTLNRG